MAEVSKALYAKILGYCYAKYPKSVQGISCARGLYDDAYNLAKTDPTAFDKKYGVGSPFAMAAPAKTTDDLFKSLQDLQQTFGQKLDLVDQQVNTANSKISSVADNVNNAPAPSSGGMFGGLSNTTLIVIAAVILLFFFRKKLL